MSPVGGTWHPPNPAEPTHAEISAARAWLAKRGVQVAVPTRLLSIRIGARLVKRPTFRYLPFVVLASMAATFGYFFLRRLFNVDGHGITAAGPVFLILFAIQASGWMDLRLAEREVAARVARPARRPGPGLLDGWCFASFAVTFVGGAALALVMLVADQGARTYAWSWLALLCLGAVLHTAALTSVLRAPAIAEDDASLAVDDWMRRRDVHSLLPAVYAAVLVMDFVYGNQPAAFTWLLAGYVLVSVATTGIAFLLHHRRPLPPGHYGV